MRRFDFIGRFETLTADIDRLQRFIGSNQPIPHEQRNPNDQYNQLAAEALDDSALMSALTNLLADDLRFHERWTRR
jgi:hypothetical protein